MAHDNFDTIRFCCPICLDLLDDPATINCGHSYCMGCIKSFWNQEDHIGVYSCPQCRQTFKFRPALGRNIILADVVEKLKKTEPQAELPAHCYAGAGDVECDVCTGRKLKAAKSCLVCLASYCESHLQPHYDSPAFKKHNLTDATGQLEEKICSRHGKLLEVYCRTDEQCICLLCVMDDHKGHDTVSAATGRTEKQNLLNTMQKESQQRLHKREKELQLLRQVLEKFKNSAQTTVVDIDEVFTMLIQTIKRKHFEVRGLVRDQEQSSVSRTEGQLDRLEQDIADLKERDAEMEQLILTEDHVCFLQACDTFFKKNDESHCIPPEPEVSPRIMASSCSFDSLKKAVCDLNQQVLKACKRKFLDISKTVKNEITKERIRAEFLQYASQLTMDSSTAHGTLCLSEKNKVVMYVNTPISYPDNPDRFECYQQVLCRDCLPARCYWEVEWSKPHRVRIAVTYKDISRKGQDIGCCFGCNNRSWSLDCSPSGYSYIHNKEETAVPGPPSSRIGVFLDHNAGNLSFYSVSDTMTLLHKVQTNFIEPLFCGFYVYTGSTVKLCPLT